MKRDWNSRRSSVIDSLHDDMAAALADIDEAVLRGDCAHIVTGQHHSSLGQF